MSEIKQAMKLAEQMMMKDSLCEAERLEEGLRIVREVNAALSSAAAAEREPVAWQRRRKYPSAPGAVMPWEQCSGHEATGHFERLPEYEYRPLYLDLPPTSELEAEVARLRDDLDSYKRAATSNEIEFEKLEARLAEALKALNLIDALDPEEHVYGCSADALRGIVIQMGQIARRVYEGGKVDG